MIIVNQNRDTLVNMDNVASINISEIEDGELTEVGMWDITAIYSANMYTKEDENDFKEYGLCETLGGYVSEKIAKEVFEEMVKSYCKEQVYEMPDKYGCPFVPYFEEKVNE